MRIQSSKVYYLCFSDTWGLCKDSKGNSGLSSWEFPLSTEAARATTKTLRFKKSSTPNSCSRFFPPRSQHKLYFLCTSAKWQYHCVVVWNIQCVKCSICMGMWGRKLSLGQAEGVRRLKNKWLEDWQGDWRDVARVLVTYDGNSHGLYLMDWYYLP